MKARAAKALKWAIGAALVFIAATAAGLHFLRVQPGEAMAEHTVFFLVLLNLNVITLIWMIWVFARAVMRLISQRKHQALGHKFKTRIVLSYVLLISVPSVLLFVIASWLGMTYIDQFFSPQFKKPIEGSMEVASIAYDTVRKRVLEYAHISMQGYPLPPDYSTEMFTQEPPDASSAIKEAFAGIESTEVISSHKGTDAVRAAVPISKDGVRLGVLVVETELPLEFSKGIEKITTASQDYLNLEKWRLSLKLNYLMIMGFLTSLLVISTLWLSIKVADSITEPVRELARATEAVAAGNYSISLVPTKDDEMGVLLGSFNHMVEEIRLGRENLEHAYRDLESIVQHIQSGVVTIDEARRVKIINQSACRILHLQPAAVVGLSYDELIAMVGSPEIARLTAEVDLRRFPEMEREVNATVGGRVLTLRAHFTGIKDSAGEFKGILVVIDDLTDVVKAQRALAWQEVARRMAHEIKNPLTPIRLSTERMVRKWLEGDKDFPEVFNRATQSIIREVESLKRLTDEFSRLGKLPPVVKSPGDIVKIVEEALTIYTDAKDYEVRLEVAEGVVTVVEIDKDQFKRAILNLTENALEAMGRVGLVSVIIRPEPDSPRVLVEVADSGPGIRETDIKRVFQPYFSTKGDGTGLGLAITERIVHEHGGRITVRDNQPHGSVFSISLPVLRV